MSKTVDALNAAFQADPNAIQALLCNRVPCNSVLADDRFVVVHESLVLPAGNFQVGAMGLVNAVLAANGLPLVAAKYTDETDSRGAAKLIGFCEYGEPAKAVDQPNLDAKFNVQVEGRREAMEAAMRLRIDDYRDSYFYKTDLRQKRVDHDVVMEWAMRELIDRPVEVADLGGAGSVQK